MIFDDSTGISNIKTLRITAIEENNLQQNLLKIKSIYYPKWQNIASILIKIRNLADMFSIFIII